MTEAKQRPEDARIVIVDDQEVIVKLMTRMLRRAGFHRVSGATDPACVHELCDLEAADLLIVDLVMPALDGVELLERLRPAERRPRPLAVLVVSGQDRACELADRARAAGAGEVLEKTFDGPQLVAAVHGLLARQASAPPAVQTPPGSSR